MSRELIFKKLLKFCRLFSFMGTRSEYVPFTIQYITKIDPSSSYKLISPATIPCYQALDVRRAVTLIFNIFLKKWYTNYCKIIDHRIQRLPAVVPIVKKAVPSTLSLKEKMKMSSCSSTTYLPLCWCLSCLRFWFTKHFQFKFFSI